MAHRVLIHGCLTLAVGCGHRAPGWQLHAHLRCGWPTLASAGALQHAGVCACIKKWLPHDLVRPSLPMEYLFPPLFSSDHEQKLSADEVVTILPLSSMRSLARVEAGKPRPCWMSGL